MPIITQTQLIELTTAATNFTLDVNDPAQVDTIFTAAPLTILGTSTITSSGTLNIGLTYKFNYTAEITGGVVTVFGEDIPTHLLDKNCEIVAIYTDAGWVVSLTPNFFESGIVATEDLDVPQGSHVIAGGSSAGSTSANVAGNQILQTLVIPANTLTEDVAKPFQGLRITVYGSCLAASKNIHLKVTNNSSSWFLYTVNATTVSGKFKIEAIISATFPTTMQSEAMFSPTGTTPLFIFNNGVTYDHSLTQTLEFSCEEVTPAGGLVTINSMRVEKIIA